MSSYTIKYGELKTQVITLIKNTVKNIDQLAIPNTLKPNYSKDLNVGTGNGLRIISTNIDLPHPAGP